MKNSFLPLFVIGATLTVCAPRIGLADTTSSSPPASGSASGGTCAQGNRKERMKEALAQLNLTDAQKAQIKQIRSSGVDRKERFEQILAVLTPDQQTKLKQLVHQHRKDGGAAPAST